MSCHFSKIEHIKGYFSKIAYIVCVQEIELKSSMDFLQEMKASNCIGFKIRKPISMESSVVIKLPLLILFFVLCSCVVLARMPSINVQMLNHPSHEILTE